MAALSPPVAGISFIQGKATSLDLESKAVSVGEEKIQPLGTVSKPKWPKGAQSFNTTLPVTALRRC